MAEGSESLEDVLKKVTTQLEADADKLDAKSESGQEIKIEINSDLMSNDKGILAFLKKVADHFEQNSENDQCSSKSEQTLKCEIEQDEKYEVVDMRTTQADSGSESLEDVMKKMTTQLEADADKLDAKSESGQEIKFQINNDLMSNDEGILTFLKKVADHVEQNSENDQCSSKSEQTLKCDIEQDEKYEVVDMRTTQADSDPLKDMLRQLNQSINNSNWLAENTPEKWMAENPELAKPYLETSKVNHKE